MTTIQAVHYYSRRFHGGSFQVEINHIKINYMKYIDIINQLFLLHEK